ncbi:MAG TPA: nucleotidyltransferase family protein [Gaiellaceae bacterium]|jgi:glucose-1-phosphate thymidylyltransferase|nr:nucleotidyltransferase family protein [Gaiellaceae bacterium]
MKAIILAAGYATRLRPLTETWAKELLPVGGRPILDWIAEAIDTVNEVDEIHIVTNARKVEGFLAWAEGRAGVVVHNDGTSSNDDRLGAIGDMQFVIDQAGLDDHLLVIAGDNLFEFSLADFVAYWQTKGVASAVAVRDVGSLELASQYGIVALDADGRILDFEEKPADPPSTLAATATYLYHREHARLIRPYLDGEHGADQPGRLVGWLQRHQPVYGWQFDDTWYDIGNHEQLLAADNVLRVARGLPVRDAYSPE